MTTSEVSSAKSRGPRAIRAGSGDRGGEELILLDPKRLGLDGAQLCQRLIAEGFGPALVATADPSTPAPDSDGRALRLGRLRVDIAGRRVFVDRRELRLSPKERELLTYLVRRPGVAVTRPQLLADLWSHERTQTAKTVDVHIRWLRQRLALYEPTGIQIVTVRGTGYRIDLRARALS